MKRFISRSKNRLIDGMIPRARLQRWLVVSACLVILLVAGGLGRLAFQPIDLTRLQAVLESHLKTLSPKSHFQAESVHLVWGGIFHPLALEMTAPVLSLDLNETYPDRDPCILSARSLKIGLGFFSLLIGKIKPVSLYFETPEITITSPGPHADPSVVSEDGSVSNVFEAHVRQLGAWIQHSVLSEFKRFEAYRGRLKIVPYLGTPNIIPFDRLLMTMQRQGTQRALTLLFHHDQETLRLVAALHPGPQDEVDLDGNSVLTLTATGVDLSLWRARLRVQDPSWPTQGRMGGNFTAELGRGPLKLSGQWEGEDVVWHGWPYDEQQPPLTLLKMMASGHGVLGQSLHVACEVQTAGPRIDTEMDWNLQSGNLDVRTRLENLAVDEFARYWPAHLGIKARRWVLSNLREGGVKHAEMTLTGQAQDELSVRNLSGFIDFSGLSVDYLTGLPTLQEVDGHATFGMDRFDMEIHRGKRDNIQLLKGMIYFRALDQEESTAMVDVDVLGPVSEILTLIDYPPLQYARDLNLDPQQTTGDAKVKLTLNFPLKESLSLPEIDITCRGTATQVGLKHKLNGLTVQATNGQFNIFIRDKNIHIAGDALWHQQPWMIEANVDYGNHSPWPRTMQLKGTLNVPAVWPALAKQGLQGHVPIELESRFAPKKGEHALKADLQGLALDIPVLGWRKPTATKGSLSLNATSHDRNDTVIRDLTITWPGSKVTGHGTLPTKTGKGAALTLLSRTPQAESHLHWKDDVTAASLRFTTNSLDARTLWAQRDANDTLTLENLDLDVLAQNVKLDDHFSMPRLTLRASRRSGQWVKANLKSEERVTDKKSSRSRSKTPSFSLDFDRDQRENPLRLTTTRAGDVLRLMGWTTLVEGGDLSLKGTYTGGDFRGHCELKDFYVDSKIPTMAKTLNLISPTGLFEMFGREGMQVSRFSSDLSTQGRLLRLKKGHGLCGSLGLSFSGAIDLERKTLNLRGSLIPAYFINSILGYIPIIGWITGGPGEGILSATFRVTGTFDAPVVQSNPLSVLTPGLVKKMLDSQDDDSQDNTVSKDQPMDAPIPSTPPLTPPKKTKKSRS